MRLSSSYAESIRDLSRDLVEQGKAAIRIEAVDESLEDEDLIEMVNAGLLPWAVVDSYKPQMWREVFDRVTVREDLVLREGARLGWALRPDSPKLKNFLNTFLRTTAKARCLATLSATATSAILIGPRMLQVLRS